MLGPRQDNLDRLREAEAAAGEVMAAMAGGPNRLGWARGRSLLGEVLFEIGRRTGNRQMLENARAAFDDARKAYRDGGMGDANQGFWKSRSLRSMPNWSNKTGNRVPYRWLSRASFRFHMSFSSGRASRLNTGTAARRWS